MNAVEARNRANEVIDDKNNKQYWFIKSNIDKAVDVGDFEASFYNLTLIDKVKDRLEEEGFVIEKRVSGPNEISTTFCW